MSSMPKEILKKYATDFEFHNQVKVRLDDNMFSITTDFGLYITVGSSDTMDVLINI